MFILFILCKVHNYSFGLYTYFLIASAELLLFLSYTFISTTIDYISRGGNQIIVKVGQIQQPNWFLGETICLLFWFQGGGFDQ